MKTLKLRNLLLLLSIMGFFTACKEDEHNHNDEQEVITTIRLTFTKTDAAGTALQGVPTFTTTWKDVDGTGAGAPVVDAINLAKGSYYTVSLAILNESANPAEDKTAEIRNEGTKHQFFFQTTGSQLNAVTYNDQDSEGKPLGLSAKISTGASTGTGTLKIILRHEPNKNGANVSNGDITNAGGETDIETTPAFNVNIQ